MEQTNGTPIGFGRLSSHTDIYWVGEYIDNLHITESFYEMHHAFMGGLRNDKFATTNALDDKFFYKNYEENWVSFRVKKNELNCQLTRYEKFHLLF
jgi:hypothetical protein